MKAKVELVLPEGVDEENLKEILAKEGIYVELFEEIIDTSCEGWDS